MNPGLLDTPIDIWGYTTTRGSMGGNVEDWSLLKTCMARRIYNKGREAVQATKEMGISDVTFRVRYNSEIDQTNIIKYDGEDYEIKAINQIGRKSYLDLFTQKKI